MRTISADQLKTIIEKHGKWQREEEGGERADLSGADLAGANLADAYLARAYLAGADLARANLAGANLAGADLARANLARANLADAYLAGANLISARGLPEGFTPAAPPYTEDEIPRLEKLYTRILAAVEAPGNALQMDSWHTCETTHCMAGWAIHLAGEAGYALEKKVGSHRAGQLIFDRSTQSCPHFFAPNARALEDLRRRAAQENPETVQSC